MVAITVPIAYIVGMAILNIRQLPSDVHARLRLRAAHNGRSMEAEARHILSEACTAEYAAAEGSSLVRDAADLHVTLTDAQTETARDYARRHHTTLEDLVRQLLDRELAADDAKGVHQLFALMDKAGGNLQGRTWTRDELYRV